MVYVAEIRLRSPSTATETLALIYKLAWQHLRNNLRNAHMNKNRLKKTISWLTALTTVTLCYRFSNRFKVSTTLKSP